MAPSRKPEHGIDPSSNPGQAGLRAAGPVGSQGTVDLVTVTTALYASESGQRPAVNLRRWGTVITIVRYQSVIFIIDQLWVAGPLALALLSMYLSTIYESINQLCNIYLCIYICTYSICL